MKLHRFASLAAMILVAQHAWAGSADATLTVRPAPKVLIDVQRSVIRDELPATLFGFNINHHGFERNLWDPTKDGVATRVTESLKALPSALYRYPGGLVANRFAWEQAVGDQTMRQPQKAVKWSAGTPVRFGIDEYLGMVRSVGGQPWYVLNLVGWSRDRMFAELPAEEVAASNARLAAYLRKQVGAGTTLYYELGNELDRADYEWPHEKYIARARATIDAIRRVDPDARFVAFLREFDWKYRADPARGRSRSADFIRDVLSALPEVEDISLHFYYDAANKDRKSVQIPWRLERFQHAMAIARAVRGGKPIGLWITEHARGLDPNRKAMEQQRETANLSSALSTGDFLIATAQMPEVRGACWHGLGASPWQLFDAASEWRERPVYWGLRVLRALDMPTVLATRTESPNRSEYAGGYDVRAAAFTDDAQTRLGLWVVNRAAMPTTASVRYAPFAGKEVVVMHRFMEGREGINPDGERLSPRVRLEPEVTNAHFSATGELSIRLPPASLSSFEFIPNKR